MTPCYAFFQTQVRQLFKTWILRSHRRLIIKVVPPTRSISMSSSIQISSDVLQDPTCSLPEPSFDSNGSTSAGTPGCKCT